MLLAIKFVHELNEYLHSILESKNIIDYRICLEVDMTVTLYILYKEKQIIDLDQKYSEKCNIEIITDSDVESDNFIKRIFSKTDKINYAARRTLGNFIDPPLLENFTSCPIVTFYSYKGGVGRSTALALFAMHLSMHYDKTIFILDCDLEAPGMMNYFNIDTANDVKNGFVEYIKDLEFNNDTKLDSSYVYEIDKEYCAEGKIYVMTSGNTSTRDDRVSYLEGLSRLSLFGTQSFVDNIRNTIININELYKPDYILIDSRTGFNDIAGILSCSLSKVVVGMFGISKQNEPGLYNLIDTYINFKSESKLILINSIISKSISQSNSIFSTNINNYIESELSEKFDSVPVFSTFSFIRNTFLEDIGTEINDSFSIIDLIKNKRLSDYVECFDYIVDHISSTNNTPDINKCTSSDINTTQSNATSHNNICDGLEIKKRLIEKLKDNFPKNYGEDIIFTDEFLNKFFYLRRSMEDIFQTDKFMLLGGKGTGKTAFYRALQNDNFFSNLQRRAQKNSLKYHCISAVSVSRGEDIAQYSFSTSNFDHSSIKDFDYFYRRFWIVYIWITLKKSLSYIPIKSENRAFNIEDNANCAANFLAIIENDQTFARIESEITVIDKELNSLDTNLMMIFDQLDIMVKPTNWSKAISPLITYCASSKLKRIHFKLFIRRDLFKKLANITNKNQLERRSINLEWSIDEIYDLFFKVIFATSKEDFFNYLYLSHQISETHLLKIKKIIEKDHSYNQLNADKIYLKMLVDTFFGKNADPSGHNRFGESYVWFYSNLRNADETISLRPFLDLIRIVLNKYSVNNDELAYPVLPPKMFNSVVRAKAVENHFQDLANEEGNQDLQIIFNDIRSNRVPSNLKKLSLLQPQFESLANDIISRNQIMECKTPMEVEDLLVINGIVSVKHISGSKKIYLFAFLYKYYLGLTGRR